jgi:hypothetical protein
VIQSASVDLTGVQAQGDVSQVIVPLSPLTANGFAGTVVADRVVALTGVGSTGSVGIMTVAERIKALTGVAAQGAVGNVIAVYWKPIDDNQTANWQNISNSQTPGWSQVDTSDTPNWLEVTT